MPSGSQRSTGDQRYWLQIHEPRGRPRTIAPVHRELASTQVETFWCAA